MEDKRVLDMDLTDAIIDRPHGFSVGNRHFYLYPITLGKTYLINRIVDLLDVNHENIKLNAFLEAIRLVKEKKTLCCKLITFHTIKKKAKLFDNAFIENSVKFFKTNCSDDELATILLMVLTSDKTQKFIHHLGIDKEHEKQEKVSKVKEDNNTFNFGGLSIYGSLIDTACERYGWTYDYVLWGISYTNLRLLLSDRTTQIYLTDEERKKCRISNDRDVIKADSAAAWEAIRQQKWD